MSKEILPPSGNGATLDGSRPNQRRAKARQVTGLPLFVNVTSEVRDIRMTVEGFVSDIRKSGVLQRQKIADIPVVILDDDYFKQQSAKRLRGVMRTMSPDGRNVALHLVDLWKQHRGFESDSNLCLYYPKLLPGASSFSALIDEFTTLMSQLPKEDSTKIRSFCHSAIASNNPQVILDLLP